MAQSSRCVSPIPAARPPSLPRARRPCRAPAGPATCPPSLPRARRPCRAPAPVAYVAVGKRLPTAIKLLHRVHASFYASMPHTSTQCGLHRLVSVHSNQYPYTHTATHRRPAQSKTSLTALLYPQPDLTAQKAHRHTSERAIRPHERTHCARLQRPHQRRTHLWETHPVPPPYTEIDSYGHLRD